MSAILRSAIVRTDRSMLSRLSKKSRLAMPMWPRATWNDSWTAPAFTCRASPRNAMQTINSQRRQLLVSAVASGLAIGSGIARGEGKRRYAAVVFDGFPIFDLRPVGAKAEVLFPGKGAALTAAWRTRQFEYQW